MKPPNRQSTYTISPISWHSNQVLPKVGVEDSNQVGIYEMNATTPPHNRNCHQLLRFVFVSLEEVRCAVRH